MMFAVFFSTRYGRTAHGSYTVLETALKEAYRLLLDPEVRDIRIVLYDGNAVKGVIDYDDVTVLRKNDTQIILPIFG